jgi:hypothetical protein
MNISMYQVDVVTNAGGVYTSEVIQKRGILMRISYKPSGTPLDTLSDLSITETNTGLNIYTQADIGLTAFTKLPRAPICPNTTGVDSSTVFDYVPTATKLTLSITQGGNVKSGTFYLFFGEL